MTDPKVVQLKRTRDNFENHIDNLRSKKNKKIAPSQPGLDVRENVIIPNIRNTLLEKDGNVQETIEDFSSTADRALPNHDITIPPLSPRSTRLHEFDKGIMSSSIDSTSLASSNDLQETIEDIKNARQIRHLSIQKTVQRRNEMIKEIRDQKEERAQAIKFQNNVLSMMVNSFQKQQMFNNLIMMKLFNINPSQV